MIGLQMLPVDFNQLSNDTVRVKRGWDVPCAAIGFLSEYLFQSESLIRVWICAYVFVFAFFRLHLNLVKHEIAGLLTVLILPAFTTWIPFIGNSYGLAGTNCWVKTRCNGRHVDAFVYLIFIEDTMYNVFLLISSVMVAAVIVLFCRGACKQGTLQVCHRTAVKAILPLLLYPIVELCVSVIKSTKNIYSSIARTSNEEEMKFISGTMVVFMYLLAPVSLPFALAFYFDVRLGLCVKKKLQTIQPSYGGTVHPTSRNAAATSRTHFVVSALSVDSAPLIIK